MSFSQFNSPATIRQDGTVAVSGPFRIDPEWRARGIALRSFRFVLVQGAVAVEGLGETSATSWSGGAEGAGLGPGPATAIGVAILAGAGPSPFVATLHWSEEIELASASASAPL